MLNVWCISKKGLKPAPFQQDTLKDLVLFQEDHFPCFIQDHPTLTVFNHGMVKVHPGRDFATHIVGPVPDKGIVTSRTIFIDGQTRDLFAQ